MSTTTRSITSGGAVLLLLCVLVMTPSVSTEQILDDGACLAGVTEIFLQSEWKLVSPLEKLQSDHHEHVVAVYSVTLKRTRATERDGQYYPRYRVDQITFDEPGAVPLFDNADFQIHDLRSGAQSLFPARDYYASSSGMGFEQADWEMTYAMYRSFRVKEHVFLVYTDAALFLYQIEDFAQQVQEAARSLCMAESDTEQP
jgi:hypothetical protein